jgi:CxxC-x17-CxxC domain-containing protein
MNILIYYRLSLRDRGESHRLNEIMGFERRESFSSGPREMHKATCAECKKECEVPFKPDGSRPVYCRDCFQKHKPQRDRF